MYTGRKRVTATSRALTLVILQIVLFFSAPLSAKPFVFTAIPDQDETRLTERFNRIAEYLAKQLQSEVRYIPVKSYPAAVAAFRNNQVQLAWFGGLTGVQARNLVPGSEAIAQGIEDTEFKSYFIAHTKAGLAFSQQFPMQIVGKSLTFGAKGSTSGRLMPEFYIREQLGKAPDALFSRVGYSGDHSRTIALVQSGAYQVGVLNYTVWDDQVKQGLIDSSNVQVIWVTPTYPDYQWSIRGDVDAVWGQGFKQKVRQALLDMKDPELLQAFPRSGFIPASNADYLPIEQTAKALGIMDDVQ